jgi:hypothetical protein
MTVQTTGAGIHNGKHDRLPSIKCEKVFHTADRRLAILMPDREENMRPVLVKWLPAVLLRVNTRNRDEFTEEVFFDRVVGDTAVVPVDTDDTVLYAARMEDPGKVGLLRYRRFVVGVEPRTAYSISVVLRARKFHHGRRSNTMEAYYVRAAWQGPPTAKEVYALDDEYQRLIQNPRTKRNDLNKFLKTRYEAAQFWKRHAWVLASTQHRPETIQEEVPTEWANFLGMQEPT